MKTLKIFSLLLLSTGITFLSFAQETKTDSVHVAGNCGMCKSRIEKTAKKAGAETAEWSADSKMLVVTFNSSSVSLAKIQEAIAAVGHDTRDYKAKDEAYNKLPGCCKYERENNVAMSGCQMEKCIKDKAACESMGCCKDGKCSKHGEHSHVSAKKAS